MKFENDKTELRLEIPTYIVTGVMLDRVEPETPFEWEIIQQIKANKSAIKQRLNSVYGSAVYTDTDSTKVVSRETLKLDKQDAQIMIDLARKIDVECGQVSCKECIMYSEEERYQTHCLLSQLNYVRRKYSDREE